MYVSWPSRESCTGRGYSAPFGPLSSKPTSWVYFMVGLEDMPNVCPHPMRKWYSDLDSHRSTLARHPPTTGTGRYGLKPFSSQAKRAQPKVVLPTRKRYASERLVAHPDLLNRYLVAKIQRAVYRAPPFLLTASRPDVVTDADKKKRQAPTTIDGTQSKLKRCRFRLRGKDHLS